MSIWHPKDRRLGWFKSPWMYGAKTVQIIPRADLPRKGSLLEYVPSVANQGNSSSCTGHEAGAQFATLAAIKGLPPKVWRSKNWFYNWARAVRGRLAYDEGAYMSDGYDMMVKYGVLLEEDWPFKGFDPKSPSSSLWPKAALWPVKGYFFADNGIDGIASAITQGHPAGMGLPWPEKWMNSKDGIMPVVTKSASLAGGHAVLCYGYDLDEGYLQLMNSWGILVWSYTGKIVPKGHFRIPIEFLDLAKSAWGGYDAICAEVEWGTEPIPPEPIPPTPTPTPTSKKVRFEGTLTEVE